MKYFKLIYISAITLLFTLSSSIAQDNYAFKIGKGNIEFPIEFEDLGPVGITDIAVFGDSIYSLENSKIHILSLKGGIGRYVPILLGKGEKSAALNIFSVDTVAVVVSHLSRRSVSVIILGIQTGKILNRIDYHRDAGSNDDQIGIQDNQSTACICGKLYVPVTDCRNLDKDPASLLVINLKNKKCKLQKQADFFKKGYSSENSIASFCNGTQLFIRIAQSEYQAKINSAQKSVSIKIKRNGEPLNVPFKLDCKFGKLWFWQIVESSTVIVSSLNLDELSLDSVRCGSQAPEEE
jgi:hypothetical protein